MIINCQKNLHTPSVLKKFISLLIFFFLKKIDNYIKLGKKNVNESTHFFRRFVVNVCS